MYKKKIAVLSALVVVLAVVYVLTFVLDPENRRDASFAWFDGELSDMADRIELSGINGTTTLVRKNGLWFFLAETAEYPVKQDRVEDFFAAISQRDIFPLRSMSQEGLERLSLTEDSASRIIIHGGARPLLDLLIGRPDALGTEIFLKRADWNEIYSGVDRFTVFTDSSPSYWYNLRMFASSAVGIDAVQYAVVKLPGKDAYILRRAGTGWVIQGNESSAVDSTRLDAWLRTVLEVEGDDFGAAAPAEMEASVALWLGDGTVMIIQAGPADEEGYRGAAVQDSPYVYSLREWSFDRIFRESSYFLK